MARNDFTDSRSRDQYPVDDDQDGSFERIDGEDQGIDPDRITAPGDIPGSYDPADGYEQYGRESQGMARDDYSDQDQGSYDDQQDGDQQDDQQVDDTATNGNGSSGGGYNQGYDQDGDPTDQFAAAHAQTDPNDLQDTAADHFANVDPTHFQQSVQQGVSSVPDHQIGGLAGTILSALDQAGIPATQVAQQAGLGSDQPHQMDRGDLTNLLSYAQQACPGALGSALAQAPQLSVALGNPIVKGLLGRLFGSS